MLMIPITFLPAACLAVVAIWLATRLAKTLRAPWLVAFLCCLALQLVLLGARYGYGVAAVLNVQHVTGVLVPTLGYLAFTNPPFTPRVAVHLLPVLIIGLVVAFAVYLADSALAFITLGYAVALALTLRRGEDAFSWAPLRYEPSLRFGLWATVATLVLSGVTDATIAGDLLITGGIRTGPIAAVASLTGLALLTICVVLFLRYDVAQRPVASSTEDEALVQRLTTEITQKELFRDPDLTHSRLAKRLALPARQISQAVNRTTGLNMSQFVNNMRITAVCDMLRTTDMSVTTAMLEAGFYTKSNFNREFRRVMGQSPTEWRNAS